MKTRWVLVSAMALLSFAVGANSDDAEECLEEDGVAMEQWLQSRGGELSKVKLSSFEGLGRGVQAVEDIREGETVIRVPLDSVICFETASKMLGGHITKTLGSSQSDFVVAATLLAEKLKGDSSSWKPYINALPTYVPVPWLFKESTLDLLESPYLHQSLIEQREIVDQAFAKAKLAIEKGLEADGASVDSNEITLEGFRWAYSLVDSRALTLQGQKYLVPGADMFNYQFHPRPRQRSNGNFFLRHHVIHDGAFFVNADRDVDAGDQLFMDYGDNSNEIYFRYHGFVPTFNPFECISTTAGIEEDSSDPLSSLRVKVMQAMKLPPKSFDCFAWDTPRSQWSRSPIRALEHLKRLDKSMLESCLNAFAKVSTRKDFTDALHRCLDEGPAKELFESYTDRIKRQLDSFSTTLAQDAELLAGGSLSRDEQLVVQYRASQKRVLRQALDYLQTGSVPTMSEYNISSIQDAEEQILARGIQSVEELRAATSIPLNEKIDALNEWVLQQKFPVVRIKAAQVPGLRVGALATEDIGVEEPYIIVPSHALIDSHTSFKSNVYPFLYLIEHVRRFPDTLHHLLLFLIFEYFVEGTKSNWWPYLALLPTPEEMYAPSHYNKEELAELEGHWAQKEVMDNIRKVKQSFGKVKKFLENNIGTRIFGDQVLTLDNYRWAHAILDSRSIWWDGERHLVPLLDMVNCKGGGKRVHETRRDPAAGGAVTKVAQSYKAGEQVFEDYGQPNHVYFVYHGFSLQDNPYACIKVSIDLTEDQKQAMGRFKRVNPNAFTGPVEFCIQSPIHANKDVVAVFGKDLAPVRSALTDFMNGFPTSLEEDLERLGKLEEGKRKNALTFIIEEKRLIRKLLQELEQE